MAKTKAQQRAELKKAPLAGLEKQGVQDRFKEYLDERWSSGLIPDFMEDWLISRFVEEFFSIVKGILPPGMVETFFDMYLDATGGDTVDWSALKAEIVNEGANVISLPISQEKKRKFFAILLDLLFSYAKEGRELIPKNG